MLIEYHAVRGFSYLSGDDELVAYTTEFLPFPNELFGRFVLTVYGRVVSPSSTFKEVERTNYWQYQ